MQTPVSLSRKTRRAILWIYGAALLYYVFKQVYYALFIEGFPDQIAQLSYAAHMARFPTLLPDFASMFIYRAKTGADGLTVATLNPRGLRKKLANVFTVVEEKGENAILRLQKMK